jgi:hypothetical protein
MARPSITGDTIVVQIENDLLVWTDGKLTGTNKEYVKAAKWMSEYAIPVDITPYGPTFESGLDRKDEPEKALAAMMGAVPGRARILEAPDFLIDLLPFEDMSDEEDESESSNSE